MLARVSIRNAFKVSLPGNWQHVRQVRERIVEVLNDLPEATRRAAAMAAAELLENAVKYGEEVESLADIHFSLEREDERVVIQVMNGTRNRPGVEELRARISEIMASEDREGLYMRRLTQLLENPNESGKLGIYRIGFEGGFDLALSYEQGVVTVIAQRGLQ